MAVSAKNGLFQRKFCCHDNEEGHLRSLIEGGWRPSIVMEQFDREHQAMLTQAQAQCADAPCVIRTASCGKWAWAHHLIIDLALRYRLSLIARNLSQVDAQRW